MYTSIGPTLGRHKRESCRIHCMYEMCGPTDEPDVVRGDRRGGAARRESVTAAHVYEYVKRARAAGNRRAKHPTHGSSASLLSTRAVALLDASRCYEGHGFHPWPSAVRQDCDVCLSRISTAPPVPNGRRWPACTGVCQKRGLNCWSVQEGMPTSRESRRRRPS